jgi:cysteinyl-tRNA synthetase
LVGGARLIGLIHGDPKDWREPLDGAFENMVLEQISARTIARKQKRFADADRIRATLAENGIILEDRPDGTTDWRRA